MPKLNTTAPKTPGEAIGRQIRRLREDLGMSQRELALAIDARLVTYQRQETGKSRLPVADLYVIAEVLGTTAVEIMQTAESKYAQAFRFTSEAGGQDVG